MRSVRGWRNDCTEAPCRSGYQVKDNDEQATSSPQPWPVLIVPASATDTFVCPVDGNPLLPIDTGVRCTAGHVFDRARERYLNLLLVQHKASRDPGDNKAMVAARTRILDSGCFAPVAASLFQLVSDHVTSPLHDRPLRLVDAGCGEGYYLERFIAAARTSADARAITLIGTDISKWAVRAAARRSVDVAWAVASNRHLPIAAASADLIVSLFGFPVWPSFRQAQADGGSVLLVEAGPRHLIELREIIYPVVAIADPPPLDAAQACGYRQSDEERLQYASEIASHAMIQDLLTMTPHAHRLSPAGRQALARYDRLSVTVDVVFRWLTVW